MSRNAPMKRMNLLPSVFIAVAIFRNVGAQIESCPLGYAVLVPCSTTSNNLSSDISDVYCPSGCMSKNLSVWGTEIYTENTPVCLAAIHAGRLSNGGGYITVQKVPGQQMYYGSIMNGIISLNDGVSTTSFTFPASTTQTVASSSTSTSAIVTSVSDNVTPPTTIPASTVPATVPATSASVSTTVTTPPTIPASTVPATTPATSASASTSVTTSPTIPASTVPATAPATSASVSTSVTTPPTIPASTVPVTAPVTTATTITAGTNSTSATFFMSSTLSKTVTTATSPAGMTAATDLGLIDCYTSLDYLNYYGDPVLVLCPANCISYYVVWGTDIYSSDSDLCPSAIHAGAITVNGGYVTVKLEPVLDTYIGSYRNGITTLTSSSAFVMESYRFL